MSQDVLMRDHTLSQLPDSLESQTIPVSPPKEMKGAVRESDGYEYLEYPSGSGAWYYRNRSTHEWQSWTQ